jgi:leader peptidase (prepilin peptidase)/N-methyltransferase
MATFIAAGIGLLLGSFLSVLLGRWPQWRGVATGRSECTQCQHELAWYDLVPLVSWLTLRGKCRYCLAPISSLYPALELTMALVLGGYAFMHGFASLWSVVDYIALFAFVSLFYFDLKHGVLPDFILIPLTVVIGARLVAQQPDALVSAFATGAIMAAFLGSLFALSRGRWLGLGDVKLAFVIGLLFGYPIAVSVTFIAIWAGALVGIGLMLARRATMQTAVPFGSFWVAVAAVAMLFPAPIVFVSGFFTLLPR